jgi:uncharacterized metal-binding protein YceD (DUF177 family)
VNDLSQKPPLEHDFDLGRLSNAGEEIVLELDAAQRAELARWSEVSSVEAFRAVVELTRTSMNDFVYKAQIEADLTQACGVTLEPVPSHISTSFKRELHLMRRSRHAQYDTEPAATGAADADDDVPEQIDSPHYDVAAPVLEEFSLAIDPYPRAAGVAFDSVVEPVPEVENPFAVLKGLKTGK